MPLFSNISKELREEHFDDWTKSIGLNSSLTQDMSLKIRDLKKLEEIDVKESIKDVELFTFEGTEVFAYGSKEGLLSILEYENFKTKEEEYER